jgi:tRNA dimethylallyltransferase
VNAPQIVLIAGPTASGKSALALELAEKLGGVIVNADSMQVYRDLRIITARPSSEEERRLPHRLYGHIDAAENFSVGRWCEEAAAALAEAQRKAHPAIVVGGTGLYFNAFTRGLAAVPPIPANIREAVRARLASDGVAALHAELKWRDAAAAARLMPGDRARITRALEVVLATGRSLLDWHEQNKPASLDPARAVKIFLAPERDDLLRRIDARFDAMMAVGALEEVRTLAARKLAPDLPAMKAHGVPGSCVILRARSSSIEPWRRPSATPANTPNGRGPGSATSCRTSPGSSRSGRCPRSRRSCARWRVDLFRWRGRLFRAIQPDGVAKWPVWMETRRRAKNRGKNKPNGGSEEVANVSAQWLVYGAVVP